MELNDLDLNKLRVFFAVIEGGGVSQAGRRLAVTRSAVSQALAALERSLGLRLFHRLGRRLVPTREGELLRDRFAEYQAVLARTLDELVHADREVRGLVRIGLFLGFPRPTITRLVAGCAARHPQARIQLLYGSQDDLRERLLGGRLDFAFSFGPGRGARGDIRSVPLFEQELVLVTSREHRLPRFAVEDLARTPVVDYYRSDPLIQRWIRHHAGPRWVVPDVRVWAATTDLVLELVLARVGVGVLPRALVAPHLGRRRLFAIGTGRPELTETIWLDELRTTAESRTARAIRAAIVDEVGRGPG
jgi:DNA-binding transcriptional LysR family regulator